MNWLKEPIKAALPTPALNAYRFTKREICRVNTVRRHGFLRGAAKLQELPDALIDRHYAVANAAAAALRTPAEAQPFFAEGTRQATTLADVMSDRFDLLGSGSTDLSDGRGGLRWSDDFRHSYTWPRRYFRSYTLQHRFGGRDVKYPWELSRCQHFSLLGRAYRATGDNRCSETIVRHLLDWIEKNPFQLTINWVCPMDVALRAVNWIVGYLLTADATAVTMRVRRELLAQLWLHAAHVEANLERWRFRNNHYLSDLLGLYAVGVLFPHLEEAPRWHSFARAELHREIELQIHNDGGNFEKSTAYQRLDWELFFYPLWFYSLARGAALADGPEIRAEFSDTYLARLRRMLEFVAAVRRPDGKIAQLGDNDDGVAVSLGHRTALDFDYILDIGAVFFGSPALRARGQLAEDAYWLFGSDSARATAESPAPSASGAALRTFADTGVVTYRSPNVHLVVSVLDNGQGGNGGHNHNDALSYELAAGGESLVVDPGTFCYSTDLKAREAFRGTAAHNTLCVDGAEINRVRELFSLYPDASPELVDATESGSGARIVARHSGYRRLNDPVMVERELLVDDHSLAVTDYVRADDTHALASTVTLAPGCRLGRRAAGLVELRGQSVTAQLHYDAASATLSAESALFSPGYGHSVATTRLVLRAQIHGDAVLRYRLTWSAPAYAAAATVTTKLDTA